MAEMQLILLLIPCCSLGETQADKDVASAYLRQSDVVYGRKHGLALTMEVFTAKNKSNGLGVIWIVSSSGMSSRAKTLTPGFQRRIKPFLEHGYKVFAVIHSSAPRFQIQDHVQDAMRAVRFVRYHADKFEVDPDRLAIAGSSAGGYLALMTAMRGRDGNGDSIDPVERVHSKVQTAGCFFPPTDLMNFARESENILDFMRRKYGSVSPSFEFYDVDEKSGVRTLIEDRDRVREKLREMSPITHVSSDDPPTILIHGDSDPFVPVQQSLRFVEKLVEAEVPNRLVVRKGKSHSWKGWESDSTLIAEWFNEHLRKNK